MSQLFEAPRLAADDREVIDDIHSIHDELALVLRPPKRWTGGLRRTSQARAIQGSNSIEGYRTGPIYIRDDAGGRTVYEGPDPTVVPGLMRALAASLATRSGDAMVRAALAHLNLVMIHPFRDGNGRMARALQTMVLAQDQVLEPTFSSIEEWLGHNTQHYYNVLAATGGGAWHPDRSTRLWVKFNLRAHHMQAQTPRRRVAEAESQWTLIDSLISQHGLPERAADAIFDALLGLRVIRPSYVKRSEVEDRTATRDLARLAELGLLETHGQTRARYYVAGGVLREHMERLRDQREALKEPYPGLISEITAEAARPGFW